MLYCFKSKAGADVLMFSEGAESLLRLMGREATPQGIFESAELSTLLAALDAALDADDAAFEQARAQARAAGEPEPRRTGVGLRQRAWPLRDLMQRARVKGHDLVWGV